MSKKKSFSGSTMTLKDFHGGSIPTDLPLPSAPGVSVRPVPDRWGPSPAAGPHHYQHQQRQRPGSAGGSLGSSARSGSGSALVDDRGPSFLSTPSNIGRYFDEDERKPFDASASFPRRSAPVPDPVSSRPAPVVARSDPKPLGRSGAGSSQNAWGIKREEVKPIAVADPVPVNVNSSAAILSSRIAQASAIEKISSGRWQSKLADVDVSRFQETVRVVDEARVSSPVQQEVRERGVYGEGTRPVSNEGTYVGADGGERPKLKLLPRTKLVEANETREVDEKQVQS